MYPEFKESKFSRKMEEKGTEVKDREKRDGRGRKEDEG